MKRAMRTFLTKVNNYPGEFHMAITYKLYTYEIHTANID